MELIDNGNLLIKLLKLHHAQSPYLLLISPYNYVAQFRAHIRLWKGVAYLFSFSMSSSNMVGRDTSQHNYTVDRRLVVASVVSKYCRPISISSHMIYPESLLDRSSDQSLYLCWPPKMEPFRVKPAVCGCSQQQSMTHVVITCTLAKFESFCGRWRQHTVDYSTRRMKWILLFCWTHPVHSFETAVKSGDILLPYIVAINPFTADPLRHYSLPYWSNPPFLTFDIWALWRSGVWRWTLWTVLFGTDGIEGVNTSHTCKFLCNFAPLFVLCVRYFDHQRSLNDDNLALPGPAGQVYIFCCCTFFFLSFLPPELIDENRPSRCPPILYQQWGPSWTHKISTDICPMLPPFYRGAKCPKFWPEFRPQSSLDRRIFELWRFIGNKNQTYQGPMIGLPPCQTWGRWVPQLWDPLAQWVPHRVKVENLLYILRSSGPRRAQRHQCYTTCWGRSCCKKTSVLYLSIRPLHFTEGQKSAAPWCKFRTPSYLGNY